MFKLYITIKLIPETLLGSIHCFAEYPIDAQPIMSKYDGICHLSSTFLTKGEF